MAHRILNVIRNENKPVNKNPLSKLSAKVDLEEHIVPVHKQLTEEGQYSYAALCATVLYTLFDSHDDKFKDEALSLILVSIEVPQQVCESARALMQGQGQDEVDPYVDVLLEEAALKDGAEVIISQLLAIAIGQGNYDARMRVFIKHVAWKLKVEVDAVVDLETTMAETLALSQYEMSEEEKLEKAKKAKRRKYKRYALIGLATIAGGTLIGVTGGLAAPLVAAGAGAIIGGAGAAVLGSTAGVAIIGTLFGVTAAGLTGYKMKKRVGAVEEFRFEPLISGYRLRADALTKQLHITIAVTGWLNDKERDFKQPWDCLCESREQYALCWETKYLVQMGECLSYVFNSAMSMAAKEALKFTVLRGLLSAIAWPSALLSVASIIDNPWSVALQRSQSAGKVLAEVLLAREQGNRPVTLIGFSLGARVIFSCLEELSKRKGSNGIVEDAILLGTPAPSDPEVWAQFAHVVAGKVVNGYSRGDWLLKFLYRTASVQLKIAGLQPVKWLDRRMHNIDLSDVVSGHLDYKLKLDIILKAVGVQTRDDIDYSGSSLSEVTTFPIIHADDLSSSDDEVYIDSTRKTPNDEISQAHLNCDTRMEGKQPKSAFLFKGKGTNDKTFLESPPLIKGKQPKSAAFLTRKEMNDNTISESPNFDTGMSSMTESESREMSDTLDHMSLNSKKFT